MKESKYSILNGNELIVEGGLEAGFSLYTGYPGSPLADYFNILYHKKDELKDRGIRVVIANSEANAAAMASGAKQAGRDTIVAMKSMGLHVASDALSVGNFANPGSSYIDSVSQVELTAGVVVVVGDDPWSISTSTPADSRFLFKHLHIPFLEPSTPQELKDWIKVALEISKRTSIYQGIILTTYMAEGGGSVECYPHADVDKNLSTLNPSEFDLSKNVMVPPNSLKADIAMINERWPRVAKVLEKFALDKIFGDDASGIGIVASGAIFENVRELVDEYELIHQGIKLLKVASPYPLNESIVTSFLKNLKIVIVVEEKRGFLEGELRNLLGREKLSPEVFGKKFRGGDGFPSFGGLNNEIIEKGFATIFEMLSLDLISPRDKTPLTGPEVPLRLPTFCPGCPHRETLSLLKDLRKWLKKQNIDLISHGDVGCYSLSFLAPFKEMHNLSAMGQGGALGAGVDLFTTNPSVVLMGDSTFYHSGLTDISNSVQTGHNITYILLDNDNTAMTGHQMSPSTGMSVEGVTRPHQDILTIVKGLGVSDAVEVNPSDRYFYQNLLRDTIKKNGVKVIVSNKECALTFHGRKKNLERKEFAKSETKKIQEFYQINTEACEDCRECVEATGCPGLTQTFDAYGSKLSIDTDICVSDSYCTKIKACPSFEKVLVYDYHPTKYKKNSMSPNFYSEVEKNIKKIDETFRVVVTGVGGSGVTTLSKILSLGAESLSRDSNIDFKFVDQKGLAQRNGNVTSHLAFFEKGKSVGIPTPLGSANVLLSPDLLDGSRHLQSITRGEGIAIIDSDYQVPLSILLDNGEVVPEFNPETHIKNLKETWGDSIFLFPFKKACEKYFGRAVYASAMILGVAHGRGFLPFNTCDMEKAFKCGVKTEDFQHNWEAFKLGQTVASGNGENIRESLENTNIKTTTQIFEQSLKECLPFWQNKKVLTQRYQNQVESLAKYYIEIPKEHIAHYLHDLYLYNHGAFACEFIQNAGIMKEYYLECGDDVLALALRILAKTYFIKDEVFVAHLMVSPIQRQKDIEKYKNLGKSFKKIHINRPAFDFLGIKIEFDINPKDWMLKIMRHLRILRWLLPHWHKLEKEIALEIRNKVLHEIPKLELANRRMALKKLDNIKGYREVRYEKAGQKLKEIIPSA